jgi:hypothetical protein
MRRAKHDKMLSAADRNLLKEKLLKLLPTAQLLDLTDVIEVTQALITVLSAPEPVRAKRVMPMVATLDRRMAEAFGREAEASTGAHRALMQKGKASAEESEASYRAELAEADTKLD